MLTIGQKLEAHKGIGPGFDFLRIALAISVVAWHTHWALWGDTPGIPNPDHMRFLWLPGYGILVMFFALSGVLITASAQRLSLGNFLVNRGMRIVPALFVEVMLAAAILGPLFTILPLRVYFNNAMTYHYLTNVVGWVNFHLPGVFAQNPSDQVNNSLWTIPYEYGCYALMAMMMTWGILKRPLLVLLLAAVFLLFGLGVQLTHFADVSPKLANAHNLHDLAVRGAKFAVFDEGSRLFPAFIFGVAAYLYRDRLPYDWRLFGACVGFCLLLAACGPIAWMKAPVLNATLCPVLVYMTAFLGVTELPLPKLFKTGDYSYGIYLYGFPMQQTVLAVFPHLRNPLLHFGLSLALVSAFATFSWHCIEKPILKQRKRFSFVARARLAPEAASEPEPAAVKSAA